VDLAGSERVHKTNSTGKTLKEAKFINVSLFYLEMVIVALHEKAVRGRQHVPYRNSMMTSVLRDSLGGNCRTIMVATINPEESHTEESISTCRFAQRVSLIKNDAVVNEDVDPALVIRRLKAEHAALRDELAFLKGESGGDEPLTTEQLQQVERRCAEYVADPDDETARLHPGPLTLPRIQACFGVLRRLARVAVSRGGGGVTSAGAGSGDGVVVLPGSMAELTAEAQRLQALVRQRDTEIAILVNMVKQGTAPPGQKPLDAQSKEGKQGGDLEEDRRSETTTSMSSASSVNGVHAAATAAAVRRRKLELLMPIPADRYDKGAAYSIFKYTIAFSSGSHISGRLMGTNRTVLDEAQTAFAYFRGRHPGTAAAEENKAILKERYERAKATGESVNRARDTINYLKRTIEQIRRERAMEGLWENKDGGPDDDSPEEDPEEVKYKTAIDEEKRIYKESFQELRHLKAEIEHIQRLLEKSRAKMQADFDAWYEQALAADEEGSSEAETSGRGGSGAAGT
ncbi:unnamed protein product, partial [Phaeothamnion confervicola]